MTKKFQIEVCISYKDMEGQSSLSFFKAQILYQEMPYPKVFWNADNECENRFSKFKIFDPI